MEKLSQREYEVLVNKYAEELVKEANFGSAARLALTKGPKSGLGKKMTSVKQSNPINPNNIAKAKVATPPDPKTRI